MFANIVESGMLDLVCVKARLGFGGGAGGAGGAPEEAKVDLLLVTAGLGFGGGAGGGKKETEGVECT